MCLGNLSILSELCFICAVRAVTIIPRDVKKNRWNKWERLCPTQSGFHEALLLSLSSIQGVSGLWAQRRLSRDTEIAILLPSPELLNELKSLETMCDLMVQETKQVFSKICELRPCMAIGFSYCLSSFHYENLCFQDAVVFVLLVVTWGEEV